MYVMRSALRMTPAVNSWPTTSPWWSISSSADSTSRSTCGFSEQMFGGKLDGQHGHGAVREVDAGAAQARLADRWASRAHVVADVGDVDVQRVVAVGQPVHPDGVVEIARGFAVDGDDVAAAEIAAVGRFHRRDRVRNRPAPAR